MPKTVTREQVLQALIDLASNTAKFKTITRKFKMWNEFPPADCPVLIIMQGDEEAQPAPRGLPTRWTLNYEFVVYHFQEQDIDTSPMTALNELLEAVEGILKPDTDNQGETCTLGGLVSHAWIQGKVEIFEGLLSGHSVAIVPVSVLAN